MIISHSMNNNPGIQSIMQRLNSSWLEEAKLWNLMKEHDYRNLWHGHRLMEYPWCLQMAPPVGKVLDIGSNPPFPISLVKYCHGVEFTLHNTCIDIHGIGYINVVTRDPPGDRVGIVPLEDIYIRHSKQLKHVIGFPDQLDVRDDNYDVIYNVSVMEHVPIRHANNWLRGCYRMLKPGGKMVITCDYMIDHPVGWGDEKQGINNHDYSEFMDTTNARIISDTRDIPWHQRFESVRFKDPDMMKDPWPTADLSDLYTVYGWVVEKPA